MTKLILKKHNFYPRFNVFVWFFVFTSIFFCASCDNKHQNTGPRYREALPEEIIPVYRFAVHALHNPVKMTQTYSPLMDYLNKNIEGANFVLETSKNYADFEEKYAGRQPEIILPNPWHTIEAIDYGYNVIAMAGEPKDFKGIFLVRKDGDIKKPSDIKGKKVSYPSATALAACIMPQYFLFENGIDVNNEIENLYVGSQESAIMNVYLKISDVGVTWPQPWRAFKKDFPEKSAELFLIWETKTLINNSIMIRDDLPENLKNEIQIKLATLHETEQGKLILQKMEIARFFIAHNKDYDIVRTYISNFEKKVRKINLK